MEADISAALSFWEWMNKPDYLYARFEAIQFAHHRIVVVKHGLIVDGRKMSPHSIRHFALRPDGVVETWESGL